MGFIKIFIQQSIVMGPLSIRIPIYRGQIPPRGAPQSKLSLEIWIFRFGRMNPLLPAANTWTDSDSTFLGAQQKFSNSFRKWMRLRVATKRGSYFPRIAGVDDRRFPTWFHPRFFKIGYIDFWKSGRRVDLRHGSPQPSFVLHPQ